MMSLWDAILAPGYRAKFHEDNQTMIHVVRTGKNPTMRHLARTHRICVQWLHERLGYKAMDPVDIVGTTSSQMAADIYTKAFNCFEKWLHACMMIGVISPTDLSKARLWHSSSFDSVRVAPNPSSKGCETALGEKQPVRRQKLSPTEFLHDAAPAEAVVSSFQRRRRRRRHTDQSALVYQKVDWLTQNP